MPEKPTWEELNLRLAACLRGCAEAHDRRLAVIENDPAERAIVEYERAVAHNNAMKLRSTLDQIKEGGRIIYNDGRPGHKDVLATVLAIDEKGMTVQFDDRADTSHIAFSDRGWMEFIEVAE